MNTIPALNLGAAPNSLHFNIMDAVKAAITRFSVKGGSFDIYIDGFLEAFENEDEVYQKYDRKYLSSLIAEANDLRIQVFRFLRDEAKYIEKTGSAEQKAAAALVLGAMDLYGGADIPSLKVDELSGVLTNLVEDLDEKYEEQMTTLGEHAQQLLADLKSANDSYKQKLFNRTEADSQFGKEAMAKARAESDKRYRILISEINNAVEYNLVPGMEDFVKYMIALVDRYRIQLGQGSSTGSSSGGSSTGEDGVRLKNVTFKFVGGNEQKFRLEPGAPLEAPANTPGYKWDKEVPEFVPNRNIIFREVPIEAEEGTATFHFLDHSEETLRQAVGTALVAPQNTDGCHWEPEVPATMPAGDTQYYEVLDNAQGGEEEGGEEGGSGSTGGGSGTGGNGGSTGGGGVIYPGEPGEDTDLY